MPERHKASKQSSMRGKRANVHAHALENASPDERSPKTVFRLVPDKGASSDLNPPRSEALTAMHHNFFSPARFTASKVGYLLLRCRCATFASTGLPAFISVASASAVECDKPVKRTPSRLMAGSPDARSSTVNRPVFGVSYKTTNCIFKNSLQKRFDALSQKLPGENSSPHLSTDDKTRRCRSQSCRSTSVKFKMGQTV